MRVPGFLRRLLFFLMALASALFLGYSFAFGLRAVEIRDEYEESLSATPLSVEVDLSRPGRVTAGLKQTASLADDQVFFVELSGKPGTSIARDTEFSGRLTVFDHAGDPVLLQDLTSLDGDSWGPGRIFLCYIDPFPKGNYQVALEVHRGAPALQGIRQTLVSVYDPCGLEELAAFHGGVFSALAAALGLALGVFAFRRVRRWAAAGGEDGRQGRG